MNKGKQRKIIPRKTRIVMRFNNCDTKERRALTNDFFEQGIGPAFFLNGDYGKPISDEVALKRGFSVSLNDWQHLVDVYWQGMLGQSPADRRQS